MVERVICDSRNCKYNDKHSCCILEIVVIIDGKCDKNKLCE
jgi:hypothetical protein